MDTQVDDVDQAKPRTPLRPSAPVFTPRTPLRACAPAFSPRTPLRACAPVFTPAAATKEGEKISRPKVALRGSATDFAHAATGVGPRQPPKAELPAMVVDGGVPPLQVSTPSPMPTPVPLPPGIGSPRPPPPQHVDDFSIAPATKPTAAAVASGQTAALAAPPSGMGHYTGLRGDGNNLSSPHSDSDQEPVSEGGLAMYGGDGGRFGFITELASAGGRMSTFGRRLGQGGCAVVTRLEMLDAEHQTRVDEYTGDAGLVVKIVPMDGDRAMEMAMEREIRVVKMIPPRCHVNVIDIMSTSMENLCMVMPAAFCDVQHLLEDKAVLEMMSFADRMMMMAGAARGLDYLHSELGLTHGDVKPENCLLTKGLVIKLADFGLSGNGEPICGLTKQYAAPEAVAVFMRREIPQRAMLQPSLDTFSLGVMMLQVLFVEEGSRFSGKARETTGALATHGFTPKPPSFHSAVQNAAYLKQKFEATGTGIDKERFEDASTVVLDLHVNYAAQPAKMGDLRSTILSLSKWNQSGELLFQEEVGYTQAFLSLLNANPLRRPSLDTVSRLLACPLLWSPLVQRGDEGGARISARNSDGNDFSRPHLPQDVREMIDTTIRDYLLADPALNTARGVWWEAPEFLSPWWKRPPIIMCIEP
ncbi:unnamed protein product [Ectocarpus sp. 6 AP-2014]